jgi:hypothetical protein
MHQRRRAAPLALAGALALLAPLVALPTAAAADTLESTLGSVLRETAHTVTIDVGEGVAVYTVRRTIHNDGGAFDEAALWIDLPTGAVATALRILAGDRWYEARLLEAGAALAEYTELTGLGSGPPQDPALLSWNTDGGLMLHVFPVAPGEASTVEYELSVPARYENGRLLFDYPMAAPGADAGAPARAMPEIRVRGAAADTATIALPVPPAGAGTDRDAGADDDAPEPLEVRGARITLPPPPIDVLAARSGAAAAATGRVIWRLELDAAPELAALPRGALVAFVVDASWSEGTEGIDAQLDLVRGYLAHVPDAGFEIITFRRRAERLVGGFAPAADVGRVIDRARAAGRLGPANGSDLGAGLAAAAAALAGAATHGAPARIVLFSDGRLAAARGLLARAGRSTELGLTLARAPAGTVVHVVVTGAPDGVLRGVRDDAHFLAPLAASTGGMLVGVSGRAVAPAEAASVALPLVRATSIDDFWIEATGPRADELDAPATIPEGTGWRSTRLVGAAPAHVVLHGRIWGREWTRALAPDPAFDARVPGIAIGTSELLALLAPGEVLRLARAAHVVSPATSYLAVEPGTRPSRAGLPERGELLGDLVGLGIGGSSCCGCGGFLGSGGVDRAGRLAEPIRLAAAACAARAGVAHFDTTLDVETTVDEIVAVSARYASPDRAAPEAVAIACTIEAAWSVRLDAGVFDQEHADFEVAIAVP